jgi:ribosomal RNA-processing protein 8
MTKNKKKEKQIKKIQNVKPKPQTQSKPKFKAKTQSHLQHLSKSTPQKHSVSKSTNQSRRNSNASEDNEQGNNNSQLSFLQQKFQKKLEGARFRTINERLYTCRGDEAFGEFQQNSNLFHLVCTHILFVSFLSRL